MYGYDNGNEIEDWPLITDNWSFDIGGPGWLQDQIKDFFFFGHKIRKKISLAVEYLMLVFHVAWGIMTPGRKVRLSNPIFSVFFLLGSSWNGI